MSDETGVTPGRAWLADLPGELGAQRRVMTALIEFCKAAPLAAALSVGAVTPRRISCRCTGRAGRRAVQPGGRLTRDCR